MGESGRKYDHLSRTASSLITAWIGMPQLWISLPSNGYTVDDRLALEIYYDSPDQPQGAWVSMDFRIPIKPL
jgi:hypothetical protein